MSPRDHFIAAALNGLCANESVVYEGTDSKIVADWAIDLVNDVMSEAHRNRLHQRSDDPLEGSLGSPMPSDLREQIVDRVRQAQNRRDDWSDDDLIAHAQQVLDDATSWENPDWERAIRRECETLRQSESAEARTEARRMLAALIPVESLIINGNGN